MHPYFPLPLCQPLSGVGPAGGEQHWGAAAARALQALWAAAGAGAGAGPPVGHAERVSDWAVGSVLVPAEEACC